MAVIPYIIGLAMGIILAISFRISYLPPKQKTCIVRSDNKKDKLIFIQLFISDEGTSIDATIRKDAYALSRNLSQKEILEILEYQCSQLKLKIWEKFDGIQS